MSLTPPPLKTAKRYSVSSVFMLEVCKADEVNLMLSVYLVCTLVTECAMWCVIYIT